MKFDIKPVDAKFAEIKKTIESGDYVKAVALLEEFDLTILNMIATLRNWKCKK